MTKSPSKRSTGVNDLLRWVTRVGRELCQKGQMLATAESCTGGLLAQLLTSRAGSSRFYWGGVVTYADESKIALLGVRPSTIKRHGAVSAPTAREMAVGLARRSGAEHTLSITGIAGPSGGSPVKPVGRVYVACFRNGNTRVWEFNFLGSRTSIRKQSAKMALKKLLFFR